MAALVRAPFSWFLQTLEGVYSKKSFHELKLENKIPF
jgi:hypothetical protein